MHPRSERGDRSPPELPGSIRIALNRVWRMTACPESAFGVLVAVAAARHPARVCRQRLGQLVHRTPVCDVRQSRTAGVRGQSTTRLPDADIGSSQAVFVTRPSYSLKDRADAGRAVAAREGRRHHSRPVATKTHRLTRLRNGRRVDLFCRRWPARAPGGVMAARRSSHLAGDPQCS